MHRSYYERHRADYLARSRRIREQLRALVHEQKNAPCADCGRSYPPYVMDFDHRDASQKSFTIGSARDVIASAASLLKEIAKCDLVCANCHRERTHNGRRKGPEKVVGVGGFEPPFVASKATVLPLDDTPAGAVSSTRTAQPPRAAFFPGRPR